MGVIAFCIIVAVVAAIAAFLKFRKNYVQVCLTAVYNLTIQIKEMKTTIELHEREFLLNPAEIETIDKIGAGSYGTGYL